jgi:hypothetical protein
MSNKSRSGFGPLRALPGQNGYGQRESEKLDAEARKMEERLQLLKMQMSRERASQQSKVGQSRWKSGAKDRGSVRNYAKDVRSRQPKKSKSRRERPTTPEMAPVLDASLPLGNKQDVSKWGTVEVGQWLQELNMTAHMKVFEQNEITGPILLEVGLDDLDYMEIKALGNRKTILKAINDLKKNGGRYDEAKRPASRHANKYANQDPSTKNSVHWSHVPQPVMANGGTDPMPSGQGDDSLADGEYSEQASHAAFAEALNEWRCGKTNGTKVDIERVDDGDVQVEAESETGAVGGNLWVNPAFANETSSSAQGPETAYHDSTQGGGGKLLEGNFDEEEEHKKFSAAVNAWRKGIPGPRPVTSGSSEVAGEDKGETQSCWYSYEIFPQDEGYFDKELGHWFKSKANFEKFKSEQAAKEAQREKRRKQLDELMNSKDEEVEKLQMQKKTFSQALYYPDSDEEDAVTSAPLIEEIESTSFDGHWEEETPQYSVEEFDELEGMDVKF